MLRCAAPGLLLNHSTDAAHPIPCVLECAWAPCGEVVEEAPSVASRTTRDERQIITKRVEEKSGRSEVSRTSPHPSHTQGSQPPRARTTNLRGAAGIDRAPRTAPHQTSRREAGSRPPRPRLDCGYMGVPPRDPRPDVRRSRCLSRRNLTQNAGRIDLERRLRGETARQLVPGPSAPTHSH